ncbi:FMN-binding protein [Streptomyces sp. NBC_00328]|uniref:FMN-binding protein n=1 Tax=Streptomyces sp. NBC_00328 TaxID=2903646 RepID=UPI002E2A8109|nr:FMN-binding protein [Streptomyces sp. NBC_00328]
MKTNHPIRRFVLASAATVSGIVLLLALKPATDSAAASAQAGAAPQQSAAGQGTPQGGTAQQSGTATVLGDVVQTQYGPVQVQLTMSGGKITKADAVQAPSGGTSSQKTELSVPKLNQETLAAQSADIDAVSGATYTSGGYQKSLQSALDKAKAAGGASGSSGSSGKAGASPAAPAAQARVVTGTVSDTQYGPVQVRLTLDGKKITKAEAVQAPSGGTSSQKTELAVPKLNQEAVAAGSAQIDTVSGATYTSEGYKKSLQSALDKAGV